MRSTIRAAAAGSATISAALCAAALHAQSQQQVDACEAKGNPPLDTVIGGCTATHSVGHLRRADLATVFNHSCGRPSAQRRPSTVPFRTTIRRSSSIQPAPSPTTTRRSPWRQERLGSRHPELRSGNQAQPHTTRLPSAIGVTLTWRSSSSIAPSRISTRRRSSIRKDATAYAWRAGAYMRTRCARPRHRRPTIRRCGSTRATRRLSIAAAWPMAAPDMASRDRRLRRGDQARSKTRGRLLRSGLRVPEAG